MAKRRIKLATESTPTGYIEISPFHWYVIAPLMKQYLERQKPLKAPADKQQQHETK